MKIDGACQCGKITYEAEVDPANAYVCNCTDCQTLAGSAFRWSITTPEENFTLLSGKPKIYAKVLEDGSAGSHQVFCPDCGSPLYSTTRPGDEPRYFNIRVATAHQDRELAPQIQYWKNSRQAWLSDVVDIKDEGGVSI